MPRAQCLSSHTVAPHQNRSDCRSPRTDACFSEPITRCSRIYPAKSRNRPRCYRGGLKTVSQMRSRNKVVLPAWRHSRTTGTGTDSYRIRLLVTSPQTINCIGMYSQLRHSCFKHTYCTQPLCLFSRGIIPSECCWQFNWVFFSFRQKLEKQKRQMFKNFLNHMSTRTNKA